MSTFAPLIPRQPVPDLALPTAGGGVWNLADQKPKHFTMIVFYRGLHCPICSKYLGDLNAKSGQFAEKGVNVFTASGDTRERAEEAVRKWGLDKLTVGYGLSLDKAREWGLFISAGRGKTSAGVEEPPLFPEPGLFVVTPEGRLYWSSVQSMPFARPSFAEILGAFDFVIAKNYPGRGEVIDHTKAA